MVRYVPPTSPNLNSKYWGREGVINSSSVVQNCTKCVQNYGTVFILKTENGGTMFLQPPKFEL